MSFDLYSVFSKKYNQISKLSDYSNDKLAKIRSSLEKELNDIDFKSNFSVITTGSYGRMEASDESDMDFFIICDSQESKEKILKISTQISESIKEHVPKNTGSTGTFGESAINTIDEILSNIGGQDDSNELLTRRMLFILEGKYIFNNEKFNEYRNILIEKYIEPTKGIYLDRYLINDIIRYYRTIATDFQFKVDENNKAWGLRNIKLKFSRKMLYYSGIISVIHTYLTYKNGKETEKVKILSSILDMSVSERIYYIITFKKNKSDLVLNNKIENLFELYDMFLEKISDKDNRVELESIKKENRSENHLYSVLNDKSKAFTKNLFELTCSISEEKDEILEFLIF
ncbi:TPA: DUF294 nucleotidyltransferase-like domain-containing protein [Proteus mirabilis]